MPAQKKDASVRARANTASTARTLTAGKRTRKVPALPAHPSDRWHAQTTKWWREIWTSPLPEAWQDFDLGSVFTLALCFNDIWIAPTASARKEALGEYRLQRKDFFIAPYNRLQGEITIEEAADAKSRGQRRQQRQGKPAESSGAKAVDPRSILHVVN